MAASSAPTKKVFFAGDISGNWDKLTSTLESQLKKVGSFDFALATGAVLSPEQLANAQDDAERSILVDDLLTEEKEAPLPTYFVDASPALIEKFGNTGGKIGDNLNFLGSHGVKEVHGLRVAYLSGKYDEEIFFESLDSGNKSEAFVNGGFYTAKAVRDLKQASRAVGNKIDVFLVSEWPEHWERKIVDAFEDHLEPTSLNEKFPPSPAIAELINSLAPRYVLCGERDVFYQRPAFQTMLAKHVTRMICLGRVGSKGKARKWLHAMQITPIDAMSAAELSAKPDDCSPFPFLISTQSGGDGGPGGPDAKRRRRNEDVNGFEAFKAQQDEKELENLDKTHLYLGNLHPGVTEHSFRKTLEKSLGGPDAIVRLRIIMNDQNECKGFGFLQVQTEEIAEQALKLDLEAAGRKIRIEVNKSQAQEKERQQQRQDARRIVVKPHSDCWFCLANPSVQKHLVLAANAHAYLALAKGGIVPQHILLLPVQHIPCFMSVFNFTEFAQIRKTVYGFVHGVKKLFRSGCGGLIPESDCLVWERWVPFPKVGVCGHEGKNEMDLRGGFCSFGIRGIAPYSETAETTYTIQSRISEFVWCFVGYGICGLDGGRR